MDACEMARRFDAHVANNMRLERVMIERRWDWRAAKATAERAQEAGTGSGATTIAKKP